MTVQPRSQEEIYDSLESRIAGAIPNLTDWSNDSPNYVLVHDGYAHALERLEHRNLAVQLSAWIDYAGGPITEQDLREVGVDPADVDLDLLNAYTQDSDLDNLVAQNGVTRDPGSRASGEIEFTLASGSAITISEGTEVATEPDSDGNYLSFFTDETVTTSNSTVTISVTAESVGTEYNVGSNTVEYLPSPPPGVQSATNANAMTSGENEELNASLRERSKDIVTSKSEGGTLSGIEGGIASVYSDVTADDVKVVEQRTGGSKQNAPYADVYVDGGDTNSEVQNTIDALRPTAINHFLERPSEITIDVSVTVSGSASSEQLSSAEDRIVSYVGQLGIGEKVVRDKIIQYVMNVTDDIENITSLIVTVIEETHQFDSDNSSGNAGNHPAYKLNKGDSMSTVTEVTGTSGGNSVTFTEWDGSSGDYAETAVDGSENDGITWDPDGDGTLEGSNPDEDTDFYVDYQIEDDLPINDTEKSVTNNVTVTN